MAPYEFLHIGKAVHGLLNAPKCWYESLSQFLIDDGWIIHSLDKITGFVVILVFMWAMFWVQEGVMNMIRVWRGCVLGSPLELGKVPWKKLSKTAVVNWNKKRISPSPFISNSLHWLLRNSNLSWKEIPGGFKTVFWKAIADATVSRSYMNWRATQSARGYYYQVSVTCKELLNMELCRTCFPPISCFDCKSRDLTKAWLCHHRQGNAFCVHSQKFMGNTERWE